MKITKDVVYAVRNKVTGKFARSGTWPGFCEDIKRAKFYNKANTPKAQLTRWKKFVERQKGYRNPDDASIKQWEDAINNAEVVKIERYLHVVETIV